MTKPILELKDVKTTVKTADGEIVPILKGINLEIRPGDFITIIGTNGAGKSTLFNTINTFVEGLSGGQRQALSFLMATIEKPDILLLDEHTAALDPHTSENLLAVTDKQIKENKLTALMITHHMEDALKYGNRLLVCV